MLIIDRNKCCGCGRCAAIRMCLDEIEDKNGIEVYTEPEPKDLDFVHKLIAECWSGCIVLTSTLIK